MIVGNIEYEMIGSQNLFRDFHKNFYKYWYVTASILKSEATRKAR